MKEYDAYLFDWDGTIAQTLSEWLVIYKNTLDSYGVKIEDREIVRQLFGRGVPGLIEVGIPEKDMEAVVLEMDTAAKHRMPKAPFYPGARELIEKLREEGRQTAVISAAPRVVIKHNIDAHGLHDAFDITVTGDEVKEHKPDPEGILFALGALGVEKDRAVMLGDSEKDILAAHNADIDSILFFPPENELFHDLAQLQADNPTHTIHSWQELLSQLR